MDIRLLLFLVAVGFIAALAYVFTVRRRFSRHDPVFGPMRFIPSQPGMWVADEAPLSTDKALLQICFDAELKDSFSSQHRFFAELDRRYSELRTGVARLVNVRRDELTLIATDIPKNGDATRPWETTWRGPQREFSVEMRGWSAHRIAPN